MDMPRHSRSSRPLQLDQVALSVRFVPTSPGHFAPLLRHIRDLGYFDTVGQNDVAARDAEGIPDRLAVSAPLHQPR
jgi:hypothetical protein